MLHPVNFVNAICVKAKKKKFNLEDEFSPNDRVRDNQSQIHITAKIYRSLYLSAKSSSYHSKMLLTDDISIS